MTNEDMGGILERLGIEVVGENGSEIQAFCPAHLARTGHEDRNPSFWINAGTGAFICFSCQFKGGLATLVETLTGLDYLAAEAWLESTDGGLMQKLDRALREKEPVFREVTDITEANLAGFIKPHAEMLKDRGLTAEAADLYGVLYDPKLRAWILPIRDPLTGKLRGWQEKAEQPGNRYFRNYPTGVAKSESLFGFEKYAGGQMIVVESPLDVVRLASVGVLGGVSTYGASVSLAQINILRGADKVVFAMDNDDAGRKSASELLAYANKLHFECWFINYDKTDRKDIGGMSKSEIEFAISKARHSLRGKKALP